MTTRREALELLGAAFVAGCGGDHGAPRGAACQAIPDETPGPYADKDGMLDDPAFYRSDVTEGKPGLPLSITFTVVSGATGCAPVVGATVEIWHCDKDGVYSEYDGQPGVTADESATTFLRGLQKTDASGQVTFTTIYPGWYTGRATHVHVEVYVGGAPVKTTQMAFPDAINAEVYALSLYTKGENPLTNATDTVFSHGDAEQLASLAGDTTRGYAASLAVGIAV